MICKLVRKKKYKWELDPSDPIPDFKLKGYKRGPGPIRYKPTVTSLIRQGESTMLAVSFSVEKHEYTPVMNMMRVTRKGDKSFGPSDTTPSRLFVGIPRTNKTCIRNRIDKK